eukprot:CAMPEP_0194725732 /NCGR_PEP_ID=MMETSP0296-20130528/28526_1 /TAXON_ID=39354 /ORGANISM="Heterosigma akashiwo, Strain CCMP2393" /LENGTH=77 /DNA_ID=CAMNT_0039630381 /DNA_START=39 /DNA_END=268 /DNA_ORIENTATION=+
MEVRTDTETTPLHVAAGTGHGAVVQVLLAAGADNDTMADQNKTALLLAKKNGHYKVAAMLKKALNECLICKTTTSLR